MEYDTLFAFMGASVLGNLTFSELKKLSTRTLRVILSRTEGKHTFEMFDAYAGPPICGHIVYPGTNIRHEHKIVTSFEVKGHASTFELMPDAAAFHLENKQSLVFPFSESLRNALHIIMKYPDDVRITFMPTDSGHMIDIDSNALRSMSDEDFNSLRCRSDSSGGRPSSMRLYTRYEAVDRGVAKGRIAHMPKNYISLQKKSETTPEATPVQRDRRHKWKPPGK